MFPQKQGSGLSAQQVGSETVVFNESTGKVVCLNRIAASVWELCDGKTSIATIAQLASEQLDAPVTEDLVNFALRELQKQKLLEEQKLILSPVLTRRSLVQQLGKSVAILLPIVAAVAIPKKAHAYAGCVLGDTPIQLADGGFVSAAGVQAGMWLRAFDPASGEVCDGRVANVHPLPAPQIHTLYTERGDVLRASPSHLLIAGHGDVHGTRLTKFKVGDTVLVYDTELKSVLPIHITGIHTSDIPQTVYGIEMWSDEHTLVTAGIVSHNIAIKQDEGGSDDY
jgi:hypothetical protein